MKVSQLLDELNISLNTLKRFEKELNCEFLFLDQIVNDKIVEKLKEILKNSKQETQYRKLTGPKISGDKIDLNQFSSLSNTHKNRPLKKPSISATKERRLQFLKGLYYNDDVYKFEAKVKWYYNYSNDGEYGFLVCNGLPDIYFKGNVVKHINPRTLRENDEVLVEIPIVDIENRTKLSATKVNKLEDEDDLAFLMHKSIELGNSKYFSQTTEQIKVQSESLKSETKQAIVTSVKSVLKDKLSNISQAIFLFEFCEFAGIDLLDDITNKAKEVFSLNDQFKLWLNTSTTFSFEHLKEPIVNHLLATNTHSFLDKLEESYIADALKEALAKRLNSADSSVNNNLTALVNTIKTYDITLDYTIFSDEQLFLFWEKKLIDFSPIDIIYKRITALWYNTSETNLNQIRDVFDKATEQELRDLFSKIHFDKSFIKNKEEFEFVRLFIDNVDSKDLSEEFFKIIYAKSPDYIKIHWFILDHTDELDYHASVIYTALLTPHDQKLFFKKVLMLIETNKLNLTLNDLNKITTIDYKTSEYSKEIDGIGLDFTLSIILKLVTDLGENIITSRKTIFDIIANQVKTPKDLLVISGFFSACSGRTILETQNQVNTEYDELSQESEATYSLKKTDKTPRFSNYCAGRKSMDNNGNPMLDRKGKREFWWCENSPCFETCRKPVSANEWKNYTIQDILRILNISYSEKQYEIAIGVINRVNRFLEHLNCNNCGSILRPNGRGNYGFYGVSMFSCCSKDCNNPDKDVYLSHCLNGRCEDIIDSRKTVKCKPSSLANPDNCGWYICNNCHACCSTEKLLARKSNLEYNGQNYNCHIDGHKDLGIICCKKCGTETQNIGINETLYESQLQWFLDHRNTSAIIASGQRNDGKWWFRWSQGNLTLERFMSALENLRDNGFQVPNLETGEEIQFIAEPFFRVDNQEPNKFVCPECNFTLEISDTDEFDFNRIKAIKSFHTRIFPTFNAQD